MPARGPLFPALLTAAVLLVAPLPAAATSQFWNGPAFATTVNFAGPWTFNTASGFASNQGSPSGDGTDMAVHTFANTAPGVNASFESIAFAEFMITGVSGFSFVDVTVAGRYLLEVFGQGSARVEAWLCQGLLNQCVVNFTPIWLAVDAITSNLSPTNETKAVPYLWNGQLIANVPYSLKLRAVSSAFENTHSRAFIDPAFTLGTPGAVLNLDPAAQITNANFVPPPVPEPSAALLLLPALLIAARLRR